MQKKIYLLLIVLIAYFGNAHAQKSPAGWVVLGSNCASGGYDYYFFPNNQVVVVWGVGGYSNLVSGSIARGTWSVNKKGEAQITYQSGWTFAPAPNAKILMVAAETIYDLYEAKPESNFKNLSNVVLIDESNEICEKAEKHNFTNADEFFQNSLRGKLFRRQYAFTSERLLQENELQRYTKSELEVMRNELFAQYNYAFQNPKWKTYFAQRKAENSIINADVFLTELEKSNLATIRAVESKKR